MTCREKLKIEHPERIDGNYFGGCQGCPDHYNYLPKPIYHPHKCGAEKMCGACWDREIPGTEGEERMNKQKTIERDINKVKESINKARAAMNSAEQEIQKLTKSLDNLNKELEKCKKKPMMYYGGIKTSEIIRYKKYNDEYIEFETHSFKYRFRTEYSSNRYTYPDDKLSCTLIANRENIFEYMTCGKWIPVEFITISRIELLEGVDEYDKNR